MPTKKPVSDKFMDKQNMRAYKTARKSEKFIKKNASNFNAALSKIGAPSVIPYGRARLQHMPFCGKDLYLKRNTGTFKAGTKKAGESYAKWSCSTSSKSAIKKKRASSPTKTKKASTKNMAIVPSTQKARATSPGSKKQLATKYKKDELLKLAKKAGRDVEISMTKDQIVSKMQKADFM